MVTHKFDLKFRAKVEYDEDDGLWYADCVDLQGCHTFGDTKDEAMHNLVEVIIDRLAAGMEFVGSEAAGRPKHAQMHGRVASPDLIEVCA